jgi:hypothetical protein
MFYVIIASAALLGAAFFPLTMMIALRYYRQASSSPRQELYPGGAPAVRGKLQQDEPKLFDVYIKPNLEVGEARFEAILVSLVISFRPIVRLESKVYLADGRSPSAHKSRRQTVRGVGLVIAQQWAGGWQTRSACSRNHL